MTAISEYPIVFTPDTCRRFGTTARCPTESELGEEYIWPQMQAGSDFEPRTHTLHQKRFAVLHACNSGFSDDEIVRIPIPAGTKGVLTGVPLSYLAYCHAGEIAHKAQYGPYEDYHLYEDTVDLPPAGPSSRLLSDEEADQVYEAAYNKFLAGDSPEDYEYTWYCVVLVYARPVLVFVTDRNLSKL